MSLCHHQHHNHDHAPHHNGDMAEKTLNLAIFANVLLTFAQIIGGLISGSLSLIADSVHNLSDAAALVVASLAIKIGKKPADHTKTFGYKRAETIAALINFVVLVSIGVFLCIEAVDRFLNPQPITGMIVIIIAAIALVVDLATALLIYSSSKDSMNLRAAMAHNIADAMGSVAVLISGIIIHYYNDLVWIDPALTVMIALYVIGHGLYGLPQAIHLLMDGTPNHIKLPEVAETISNIDGVLEAHHIHIWQIDEWRAALEAHVVVEDLTKIESIKASIKKALLDKHNISHSTLEFEDGDDKDNFLDPKGDHGEACHIIPSAPIAEEKN